MIESSQTAATDVPPGGDRRPHYQPRRRRLLRVFLCLSALAIALVLATGIGLRLYFSDARLRQIAEDQIARATGVEAQIQQLQVSLFSGVEIVGFSLGPPQGFTLQPVVFDRVALHWSLWEILRLNVVIDEIAVEGMHVTLEENEHGRALDKLHPVAPPAAPASAPPPTPKPAPRSSAGTSFADLSLPVHVVVRRLAVTNFAADVRSATQQAHVDTVNVVGKFNGQAQALALDLWLGLGEPDKKGATSHLSIVRNAPPLAVDANVRFAVHVVTTSLRDIQAQIDLDSHTTVAKPYALPALDATSAIRLAVDLLAQTLQVSRCDFAVGNNTRLTITAAVRQFLSTVPELDVGKVALTVDLDELAPIVDAVVPKTTVGGTINLDLSALSLELGTATPAIPATTLSLTMHDLHFSSPTQALSGAKGELMVNTVADEAHFTLSFGADRIKSAELEARALQTRLEGTTPIGPLMGGPVEGVLEAKTEISLGAATAPQGRVRDLKLSLDATVPLALALAKDGTKPMVAHLRLATGSADTTGAHLDKIKLDLQATTWDQEGKRLDVEMMLGILGASAKQQDAVIDIPPVEIAVSARRNDDDYNLRQLRVDVRELFELRMQGGLANIASQAPQFHRFDLAAKLPCLECALAMAPKGQLPPVKINGALSLGVSVDGVVPIDTLLAQARLPRVDPITDQASWHNAVQTYADYADSWAAWLKRGSPFTAALRLDLANVDFSDDNNEVSGLTLSSELTAQRHGPKWHLATDVARVTRPSSVEDAHLEVDLRTDAADTTLALKGSVASIEQKPFVAPLAALAFDVGARFQLGGDLTLDRVVFSEKGHGIHFDASGVVVKPLALALERGWEKEALPGLDATFRFALGYGNVGSLAAVTESGVQLAGAAGLGGTLRIDKGAVALAGQLKADDFSYVAGPTALENLSGSFPFAVDLFAGRRNDGTIVARTEGFGGGTLSLLVKGDESRRDVVRPAYYQRLRPYRGRHGLSAKRIKSGPYQIADFRLDGGIDAGRLWVDEISLNVLGGDISGNLAVALGRDASLSGELAFAVSGIDASNFSLLHLAPGPDSELNADLRLGFLFAPRQRDLSMSMNVTKIGAETLDRFLQLLDPEGRDKNLQSTRSNLGWVRIDEVAIWVRYESLNMDLAYSTKLRIPFTQIGYHPIPRELLRRYSLSEMLDAYLQPSIDDFVAKPLGWTHAR